MGDSKTSATPGYVAKLLADLPNEWYEAGVRQFGTSGWNIEDLRNAVDANIGATTHAPDFVLINIGVNNILTYDVEATWKGHMQAILTAINTQWPRAQVYIMRPWLRGAGNVTALNHIATWISDLVALNSFAHLGPDERVFLENGDDGATYTTDGTHPTEPDGYQLTADQWRAVMGY